jgi:hypothetical protein
LHLHKAFPLDRSGALAVFRVSHAGLVKRLFQKELNYFFCFVAVPQITRVMPAAVERFVVLPLYVALTLYHSQCRNKQLLIKLCSAAVVANILGWHSLNSISIHLSP